MVAPNGLKLNGKKFLILGEGRNAVRSIKVDSSV